MAAKDHAAEQLCGDAMTDLLTLEITPALATQLLSILKQIPLQTVQQKRDAAGLQEAIEKALEDGA